MFAIVCYGALVVSLGSFIYIRYFQPVSYRRQLNISCLVYRDLNRNGIYDLGDRPFAGAVVQMSRPADGVVTTTSNLRGFANYSMGLRDDKAQVHDAGTHVIRVKAPPSWSITSQNGEQSAVFRELPGSPVGLVTERIFVPVGFAPDLRISGTAQPQHSLRARAPTGEWQDVAATNEGGYSFPATPGEWTLEYSAVPNGPRFLRRVTVVSDPVVVSRLQEPTGGLTDLAPLQRVDFDDLTTAESAYELPNGYGGLDWFGWVATHELAPNSPGFVNGTRSGEYVAYTSSGHPSTISRTRPFDFVGAQLTQGWKEGEGSEVRIRAWRGDHQIHEDRLFLTVDGPIHFAADYRGVTRVEVDSAGYWQIALESLEYRLP